jgi:hypothetical protein
MDDRTRDVVGGAHRASDTGVVPSRLTVARPSPGGSASRVHYGWIILAAGTFGSFMTLPGQTAGVSVFFDPITADLGISRTWASTAYAAGTLAGILPAPMIGRWIDRRGPDPAPGVRPQIALARSENVRTGLRKCYVRVRDRRALANRKF